MNAFASLLARNPFRFAAPCGNLAIERHRILQNDIGISRFDVVEKRSVDFLAFLNQDTLNNFDACRL